MVVVTHGVWSHPVQSGRILVVVSKDSVLLFTGEKRARKPGPT